MVIISFQPFSTNFVTIPSLTYFTPNVEKKCVICRTVISTEAGVVDAIVVVEASSEDFITISTLVSVQVYGIVGIMGLSAGLTTLLIFGMTSPLLTNSIIAPGPKLFSTMY